MLAPVVYIVSISSYFSLLKQKGTIYHRCAVEARVAHDKLHIDQGLVGSVSFRSRSDYTDHKPEEGSIMSMSSILLHLGFNESPGLRSSSIRLGSNWRAGSDNMRLDARYATKFAFPNVCKGVQGLDQLILLRVRNMRNTIANRTFPLVASCHLLPEFLFDLSFGSQTY
jgi:hypothetical protein